MPRLSRMYFSGLPYHIVQRSNNREACFYEIEDYQYYLDLLKELAHRVNVNIHAYVLMTNHIHLLATPVEADSISKMTKVVGSRFAQYMNKKYGRIGTLWEGRHKSSLVDTENYLLKCYRYIELNPVVANMVKRPEEYIWSSYSANAWGDCSELLTPHDEYLKLAAKDELRQHAYRELFSVNLSEEDLHAFRKAAHYCQPIGSEGFRQQIEEKLGVSLGYMKRGRPRVAKL